MLIDVKKCASSEDVCKLITELYDIYKSVEILSITLANSYWIVYYKLGDKKK